MDVGAWLKGLSLERYEHAFRANDIDASLLPEITPEDLIELGVTSIGHRRKLLAAIAELRIPQEAAPSRRPDRPVPQGGAERRQLTIMFIDLVGSTALSTRLDPEEMGDLIRAYQKVCTGVIGHWGGRVAKYMGDGVLAYFGFPQAHEDDAERAVRAGLQMCQEIARMIADGQPMAARIGIATGLVMVGELIGEGGAQEDAVIGDTPNLAARLQGLAEPGSVVIAPSTRKLLHNLFELRDLGMHSLKGFDAPIQAWQTVSERSFESRFEAYRTIGAAPLVGRDDELEILMRQWRRAIAGDGQTALLVGDAGIGKSRLVAALQEQIAGTPHLRVTYQCSPHHADNTLYPVIRQLEHAAGIRSHHSPAERLERFEALLSSSEDAAKGDASLLASLLSIPSDGRYPAAKLGAQEFMEHTFRALLHQLDSLTASKPLLVLFEDVHWADPATLEFVDRLVEYVESQPILVVVTTRPGFSASWTDQAHVALLAINRMGKRQTHTLIDKIAGNGAVPQDLIDEIIEKGDGNPLFIEEITRAVLEDRATREGHETTRIGVPASLQDSLMARLDRLATGKPVVQAAAAIGREVTSDTLEKVSELSPDQLAGVLDELVAAGILNRRGGSDGYTFKHALVQDAAYNSLLLQGRKKLHRRIAEKLRDQLANQPALLAHHWECAGSFEEAFSCRHLAGNLAINRGTTWEAFQNYWLAVNLLDQSPDTLETQHLFLVTILKVVEVGGDFFRTISDQGRGRQYVQRAIKIADSEDNATALAVLKAFEGKWWQDPNLLVEALDHAAEANDRRATANVELWLSAYHGLHGSLQDALIHTSKAIELYGDVGAVIQQGLIMAGNGRCYAARAGKLELSFEYARRARSIAEDTADPHLKSMLAMEAEPCLYAGLWQMALDHVDDSLPIAWDIGNWGVILFCTGWAAICEIKLNRIDSALRRIDETLKGVSPRKRDSFRQCYLNIALGKAHRRLGNLTAAHTATEQALKFAEQAQILLEQGAAFRALAQIDEAMGDRMSAESNYRRSLEILESIESRPELAQSLLAFGKFKSVEAAYEGRNLMEQALTHFEAMEAPGWIAEARAALAH